MAKYPSKILPFITIALYHQNITSSFSSPKKGKFIRVKRNDEKVSGNVAKTNPDNTNLTGADLRGLG